MKYLDTGARNPKYTLAHWLHRISSDDIVESRIQTGFFAAEAIEILRPSLEKSAQNGFTSKFILGSNEKSTLKSDVEELTSLMNIPRAGAELGVVSYSNCFFHPKTYHFVRADGSQAAYVGSSNFTKKGLALHVEAAIALDTYEGDDVNVLNQISLAIDEWFTQARPGFSRITGQQDIDDLANSNILGITRPQAAPNSSQGANTAGGKPSLNSIYTLPAVKKKKSSSTSKSTSKNPPVTPTSATSISVQRAGFPHYILFENNSTGPTYGVNALTGTQLANNYCGVIIKINKDSGRHFVSGTSGTANISVPVEVATTLRFGVYGTHNRPRAEFEMEMRYLNSGMPIHAPTRVTSIMGYGFTPNESGHGDIRVVVTAAAKSLAAELNNRNLPLPAIGDYAILEWPTVTDPKVRLTFLDCNLPLFAQLENIYGLAETSSQLVGKGACWLQTGISPTW